MILKTGVDISKLKRPMRRVLVTMDAIYWNACTKVDNDSCNYSS